MKKETEEPVEESKPFQFDCDGILHDAYVRYYDNGDMDMEISMENPSEKSYEKAWSVAESLD